MPLKELFLEILEEYPKQRAKDDKSSNPYFKDLSKRILKEFEPFAEEFGIRVKPLGGQAVMRKFPYISLLGKGHKTSKGIYPIYFFDSASQKISLKVGDADNNEPPEGLAEKFAARSCEMLPHFTAKSEDNYPGMEYTRAQLVESELQKDLRAILEVYNRCLEEFSIDIEKYLEASAKDEVVRKDETEQSVSETQIQDLINRFLEWFQKDPHKEKEFIDEYKKFSREYFASLSDADLVEVMFRFASEGGKIQTGGERTAGLFRDSISQKPKEFRNTILEIFDDNFDIQKWWKEGKSFSNFGRGVKSTLLHRIFPDRYAIFNYKAESAYKLLNLMPRRKPDGAFKYGLINDAARRLVQFRPDKLNLFRADAMTHFLLGTPKGKQAISQIIGEKELDDSSENIWVVKPGRKAKLWEEWLENGYISIGWSKLGDASTYESVEDFRTGMEKYYPDESKAEEEKGQTKNNNARSMHYFAHEMSIDDIVIAATGARQILGAGRITGDYEYVPDGDNSDSDKVNRRKVEWIKKMEKILQTRVALKTVTPITVKSESFKEITDYLSDIEIPSTTATWTSPFQSLVDRNPNLILYGPPGTGKTYLALDFVRASLGIKDLFDPRFRNRWDIITFHQSYSYEQFVEGISVLTQDGKTIYSTRGGIFKSISDRATKDLNNRYVLIIDEINRGNISKIFGELITLLEKDKRIGAKNEVRVRLPYSAEMFGVPPNLYVIGTMNTADRSIALIDVALRRRFHFQEIMPSYNQDLWQAAGSPLIIGGINLIDLLRSLNERIRSNYSRDHQLGHSYLMGVVDFQDLKFTWFSQIIPLLQEYFFNDNEKLYKVLGSSFVHKSSLGGEDDDELYDLVNDMPDEDFLNAL